MCMPLYVWFCPARCIAISSLGIFMYEELSHDIMHPKLKEAVNTLLSTLKVQFYPAFPFVGVSVKFKTILIC